MSTPIAPNSHSTRNTSSRLPENNRIVRVLIVDDWAYVRKAVTQMLMRSPFIEVVGTARDGEEALELVERLNPDVVTLDLIMPRLDGVGFLKAQMARRPLPVLVVSIAGESGPLALQALDAGAVDFVQKPTALATEKVLEISDELVRKVKEAAGIPVERLRSALQRLNETPQTIPPIAKARLGLPQFEVLVLGASTGGPRALKEVISRLPANFPLPMALVLHMPIGYTQMFAESLNKTTPFQVEEAMEGSILLPGKVLVAPAGKHLLLRQAPGVGVVAQLDGQSYETPHKPAVDVLFRSAAETYGSHTLGVVLTGMGSDGLQGSAWIKAKGGTILTEAEESCIVYGMPRSIIEAGLSDKTAHLDQMARTIVEVL
jgi:two-component system chemotaxis response regulator CheB